MKHYLQNWNGRRFRESLSEMRLSFSKIRFLILVSASMFLLHNANTFAQVGPDICSGTIVLNLATTTFPFPFQVSRDAYVCVDLDITPTATCSNDCSATDYISITDDQNTVCYNDWGGNYCTAITAGGCGPGTANGCCGCVYPNIQYYIDFPNPGCYTGTITICADCTGTYCLLKKNGEKPKRTNSTQQRVFFGHLTKRTQE